MKFIEMQYIDDGRVRILVEECVTWSDWWENRTTLTYYYGCGYCWVNQNNRRISDYKAGQLRSMWLHQIACPSHYADKIKIIPQL